MPTIEHWTRSTPSLTDFLYWQGGATALSVGLVTGSCAFRGPRRTTRRAEAIWAGSTGPEIGGVTIRTAELPSPRARLPGVIAGAVEEHRPDFYVSLGLATGEAVLRFETTAINRWISPWPTRGREPPMEARIEPEGPPAHFATWDAAALARELLDNDLPATSSHHAGHASVQPRALLRRPGRWRARASTVLSASCICPTRRNRWRPIPEERPPGGDTSADDAARPAQHAACERRRPRCG